MVSPRLEKKNLTSFVEGRDGKEKQREQVGDSHGSPGGGETEMGPKQGFRDCINFFLLPQQISTNSD